MKTSKIGKHYTSGVRSWLKNVACLSSPLYFFYGQCAVMDITISVGSVVPPECSDGPHIQTWFPLLTKKDKKEQ